MEKVFHAGEIWVQKQARTHDDALYLASVGMVKPTLKFGHSEFIAERQEALVASVDPSDGTVWASVVFGKRGFVRALNSASFLVQGGVVDADPLKTNAAVDDAPLGFLFIELSTRRRNRANGISRPSLAPRNGLSVAVRESFGNCPKYIQLRALEGGSGSSPSSEVTPVSSVSSHLSASQKKLIGLSDTMFLASYAKHEMVGGADMSHRGGFPGFVRIINDTELWWPDYSGNGLFNSLGNLVREPRCGLLFLDFEARKTLQLTGRAQVLLDDATIAEQRQRLGLSNGLPEGDPRICVFQVDKVIETAGAIPYNYQLLQYSPANPQLVQTSVRDGEAAQEKGHEVGATLGPVTCVAICDVADGIKEFAFELPEGVSYSPGQYATFTLPDPRLTATEAATQRTLLTRHWTISSSPVNWPKGNQFTITVKRHEGGVVSSWLHDVFRAGDSLDLRGIEGSFVLHPRSCCKTQTKLLFLSAGIGITPMISMLRALRLCPSTLACPPTDLVFLHTNRTTEHIPYRDELVESHMERADLSVRFVFTLTGAARQEEASLVEQHAGRLTERLLSTLVPDITERQVYLCGPDRYMSEMTQYLQSLGLAPGKLVMEAFDY